MIATMASDLGGWTHDLSPVIFRVFGLSIRWYGVSYLAGLFVAWLALRQLAKRNLVLIPTSRVEDFMMMMAIGVIAGGRLGYCLFYAPDLFITFENRLPFWGVLMTNQGGMASHGGILGVILMSWRISRGFKNADGEIEGRCPPLHVMDIAAFLVPFGMFFGRIANFINSELLGRIVAMPGQHAPWWSVRFPQEIMTGHAPELSPAQATELRRLIEIHKLPGETDTTGIEAMIARLQHGSTDLRAQLEPLLAARHPSQLYQAVAEGIVLGLVLWFIWRRPRLPGVVGCWFLITYGVLRIGTELFRLPDDQLAVQRIAGLSRGQWLSVLMILAGTMILRIVLKRGGQKLGGWARHAPPPLSA